MPDDRFDRRKIAWNLFLFAFGVVTVLWLFSKAQPEILSVELFVPALSGEASRGRAMFNALCARCHGADGRGGANGPPLIHKTYGSVSHPERDMRRAIAEGASQHHWKHGDMPAFPNITAEQITALLAFIRETQKANGIE